MRLGAHWQFTLASGRRPDHAAKGTVRGFHSELVRTYVRRYFGLLCPGCFCLGYSAWLHPSRGCGGWGAGRGYMQEVTLFILVGFVGGVGDLVWFGLVWASELG
jgi:hypothetical protein